jgi:hypothetical protein
MQLCGGQATIFKNNKKKFAPERMKKALSKVGHNQPNFFFSIANRPKTSSNLKYFSLKFSTVQLFKNDFSSRATLKSNCSLNLRTEQSQNT